MAVSAEHRNKGVGTLIVKGLQDYAKERGSGIWCNARIRAIPVYERCGFVVISDVYDIEGIGPHRDMEWMAENYE